MMFIKIDNDYSDRHSQQKLIESSMHNTETNYYLQKKNFFNFCVSVYSLGIISDSHVIFLTIQISHFFLYRIDLILISYFLDSMISEYSFLFVNLVLLIINRTNYQLFYLQQQIIQLLDDNFLILSFIHFLDSGCAIHLFCL